MEQEEIYQKIWDEIHKSAKEQKITAKKICEECKIKEDTYKHKSAKKSSLSLGDLLKICAFLGIGIAVGKLIADALKNTDKK